MGRVRPEDGEGHGEEVTGPMSTRLCKERASKPACVRENEPCLHSARPEGRKGSVYTVGNEVLERDACKEEYVERLRTPGEGLMIGFEPSNEP